MPTQKSTSQTLEITHLSQWEAEVPRLLEWAGHHRVWCFSGDLGAGKTTTIQYFCQALGVQTPVTSPSYGLVHAYVGRDGHPIYHLDLYRLHHVQEALEIGCEEYLSGDFHAFVEWSQHAQSLLPNKRIEITMTPLPSGARHVVLHRLEQA